MPLPNLQTYFADPKYRALSPSAQVAVIKRTVFPQLDQDPEFQKLNSRSQRLVKSKLLVGGVTFDDGPKGFGEMARQGMLAQISGGVGAGRPFSEFIVNVAQSSGIANFLISSGEKLLGIDNGNESRRRALEFMRLGDTILDDGDFAATAGRVIGVVGDILAVNTGMAGLVGKATAGLQTLAKGGKAMATLAKAAGTTAPIVKPVLHSLAPLLAESAVEAVPYFLIEEQRRVAAGQPSVISGGATEVAKVLGINAAADFFVGTVLQNVFLKAGKVLFGPSDIYKAAFKNAAEESALMRKLETGSLNPVDLATYSPVQLDKVRQGMAISDYLRKGAASPDTSPWEATALMAHDMGKIVGEADDGTYRLWDELKNGRPVSKSYKNLTELQNHLALESYQSWLGLPEDIQSRYLTSHRDWMIRRGETLYKQRSLYTDDTVVLADEAMGLALKKDPSRVKLPWSRIAVTPSEAGKIQEMVGPDGIVVRTKLPLRGTVVDNINDANVVILHGSPTARVLQSDDPNAVFVGVKGATDADYQAISQTSEEIIKLNPKLSIEEARAIAALDKGFDFYKHADGSVEFFTTRSAKLLAAPTDILKPIKATKSGLGSPTVTVTEKVSFRGGKQTLATSEGALLSAALKASRTLDSDEPMANFVRSYMAGRGKDVNVKVTRTLGDVKPSVLYDVDTNTVSVTMPKNINSYLQEREAVGDLISELINRGDELHTVTDLSKKTMNSASDYWRGKVTSQAHAFTKPSLRTSMDWMKSAAKHLDMIAETIDTSTVRLVSRTGIKFTGSIADASKWLSRRIADTDTVLKELKSQGIRVMKSGDGFRAVSYRNGKALFEADSIPTLLDRLDYDPEILSPIHGPKAVMFNSDGSITFELETAKRYRNAKEAFKELEQFKHPASPNLRTELGPLGKTELSYVNGIPSYTVRLNEWNAKKTFNTLDEARSFLRRDGDEDIQTIREILDNKLAEFYIDPNGAYTVRYMGQTFKAQSLNELKKISKDIPDVTDSLPPLLDPSLEAGVSDLIAQYKTMRQKYRAGRNLYNLPPEFDFDPGEIKKLSPFMTLRSMFSNFTSWIEDVAKRTNNPTLGKMAFHFREATRKMHGETLQANRILDTIFHRPNGKYFTTESRRKIFYHLGATSDEQMEQFKEIYQKRYNKPLTALTDEETVAASRARKYLDSLGKRFGIRLDLLVTEYMPRVRDLADPHNAEILNGIVTADDLLDKVWKTPMPKELKWWAENARVEDITRAFLKDDAFEVLALYTAQGMKKYHLNDQWKTFARFLKEGELGPEITQRINLYRENIMSSYHSRGEQALENFGAALFRSFKNIPVVGKLLPSEQILEESGRKLLSGIMSMTYFTAMGFKPVFAIRNVAQVYSMVGPRVGLDWLFQAQKKVLDFPQETFERLRKLNVLDEKAPIVNSLAGHETVVGRVVGKSLESFKNSEDLSRAIAYVSGELRFDDAISKLKLGLLTDQDSFLRASGLSVMDDTTKAEVLKLVAKGDDMSIAGARDIYANKLQRDGLFDYSGADTPGITKTGLMGVLFGQFGTYSAGFRANLANMFKYGSTAEKVKMVATYLAVTAGLAAGFEAMRIKTNDFTPFAGAFFGGGPMFDVAINAVKGGEAAVDQFLGTVGINRPGETSYESKEAWAKFGYDIKSLVPGSSQIRALQNYKKKTAEGDSYGAFLSLLMTPVTDLE